MPPTRGGLVCGGLLACALPVRGCGGGAAFDRRARTVLASVVALSTIAIVFAGQNLMMRLMSGS